MDTKHLRAAIAVARHCSFTNAARELYMAQSTLSRQVNALERHLGTELFVRGVRSVTLTNDGRAFLPEAERVLGAVARAERAVKGQRGEAPAGGDEPLERPAAVQGAGSGVGEAEPYPDAAVIPGPRRLLADDERP